MNITEDLKRIVDSENDLNSKKRKNGVIKSIEKSYSLQKEEYKYTPLLKKIEKKFNLLAENKDITSQKSYSEIKKNIDSEFYIICVDGFYKPELSNIPPDISIKNFSKLSDSEVDRFEKIYQQHDDSKSDFLSSLNSIIHNDCLTIAVDNNYLSKECISIVNIIENYEVNNFRKMIFCDKGSEVSFFEYFIDLCKSESFSSSVTEIYLSENSKLNYYSSQDFKENYHYNSINTFQRRDSVSNFYTVSFSGITLLLKGPLAAEIIALVL